MTTESATTVIDRRLSIAPMMAYTDRHCRYLLRLLSRHALLYTEMVTTGALVHGDRSRHLDFDPFEQPLALQIGGSDPAELATSARLATDWGYSEINLNVGCPSDRVQSGRFGACLMHEPAVAAAGIAAMRAVTSIPVTVKTRIGVDERDSYEHLHDFVSEVHAAGCNTFIIHARKAWLKGLSPKENRSIPPLDYPRVYQLKRDFPQLTIVINGGIETLAASKTHLKHVDGVMIGRAACNNPYMLASADRTIFGMAVTDVSRADVLRQYRAYMDKQLAAGERLSNMARHLLGLYMGQPGARHYRRILCEQCTGGDAGLEVIDTAVN
ncbi:MAG: tRNA dihydrouridine(20/20a) synthase DusA, partial [Gammaproteobacteria bacterium]